MGCNSCATKSCSTTPKGCRSNGNCGTSSCGQLSTYNWLSDVPKTNQKPFLGVEVRFKADRKEIFYNSSEMSLLSGDIIVVEGVFGYDVGVVSLVGELVRLQMQKKLKHTKIKELKEIYRKATEQDVELWRESVALEEKSLYKVKEITKKLNLDMKVLDVEFQGDKKKITIFYTAEKRVDFRELIKQLSSHLRVRVEMRQIGLRQEAAKLGGIGVCGRELCCSTWLTDFRPVTTSSARYQQLSINPQKLSGQCGKLKCCLNFELDTYLEELQDFPKTNTTLKTKKGNAKFVKMDVFKKTMYYTYPKDSLADLIEVKVERVHEIIKMNKKNNKPLDLVEEHSSNKTNNYNNNITQDSITRFDKKIKI